MPERRLKFKYNMPYVLELKLKNKYGYTLLHREYADQIVIFQKTVSPPTPYIEEEVVKPEVVKTDTSDNVIYLDDDLTAKAQTELERRCDNIVDYFDDPYSKVMAVRQRLHNMSQGLGPKKRQFVVEYMDENFPEAMAFEDPKKQWRMR